MSNLLILSFDEHVRSESNAFDLAEKATQLFKQMYPDNLVDYYDLLQEEYGQETSARFELAQAALMVCSLQNNEFLPDELRVKLLELKKYEVHMHVTHISLLVPYQFQLEAELVALLQDVFSQPVRVVTKVSALAEQFLSL